MKTAISLPDQVFDDAEELGSRLGMSRSQLYATALEAFVRSQRDQGVTEALDRIYAEESSELDPVVSAIQSSSMAEDEW